MAKIYDAQIQWQSPTAHRFQAQPLEDYISTGLQNVSRAAGAASEGIQKLHDQDAAAKMKEAGIAAQNYIDNFEDFSGDNYMSVMEANAMKFWDDAFAQLDEPTKRRFEMNNPKARDIFNLKAHESAVEKTFNHQAVEYSRRVPVIASQIVSLGDPNAIKKGLADVMNDIYKNSGMRAKDAEKVVDAIRLEVADGAIAAAIGEGRLSDAAALNNDLDFSSALTPAKRASNNITIQKTLDEQIKAKKELTEDKKREALTNALVDGSVNLYDALYASAGQDTLAREKVTTSYNKFLSDFLSGNIKDEYNGVPVSKFFPEIKLYTDAPFSVRQNAVKKIVGQTLENNPTDKKLKAELGYRVASLAASLPQDDDGYVDLEKVKPEEIADIFNVLDQVSGYYSFDDGVQKQIDKLVQLQTAYRDRASLALKHSAYQDQNTLINQQTGLGWETQRYMQSGNLAPDTMEALRKGVSDNSRGIIFSPEYRKAMVDAMENFAHWTTGGQLPTPGSYEELAMMEIVALQYMPLKDKQALGIADVLPEQFVDAWMKKINAFDALGVLHTDVPDEVETDAAGQILKYVPGAQSFMATVAPQTALNAKAKGQPLEKTAWYQSMMDTVKYLNGDKQVDEAVLADYAAGNRSTQYKYGADRVSYMQLSNKARAAAKDTRAHENPRKAAAYKIKVNK